MQEVKAKYYELSDEVKKNSINPDDQKEQFDKYNEIKKLQEDKYNEYKVKAREKGKISNAGKRRWCCPLQASKSRIWISD